MQCSKRCRRGLIHKAFCEVSIPFLPWQGTLQIKRGNKLFLSKPFTTIYLGDKFHILPRFLFSFPFFPFFHHLLDLCLSPLLAVPADALLEVDSSHPKLLGMLSGQHPEDTNKMVLLHTILSKLIFKMHFFSPVTAFQIKYALNRSCGWTECVDFEDRIRPESVQGGSHHLLFWCPGTEPICSRNGHWKCILLNQTQSHDVISWKV